jgi:hypothetical protein
MEKNQLTESLGEVIHNASSDDYKSGVGAASSCCCCCTAASVAEAGEETR